MQIWTNNMIPNQAQWYTTVFDNLVTITAVYALTQTLAEDAVNIVQVCSNALQFFSNTTLPAGVVTDILVLMNFISDSQRLLGDMADISMSTRYRL